MADRILIMAGGTGGHVFPALAVAAVLRERGAEVQWLGTRRGLESRLVPAAGIPLATLSVAGLRGKGPLSWLAAPFKLAWSLGQSLLVILRFRPMAVLGMGGFASGPGAVMTWLLHLPLLIHEQNAVAGLTNRVLARLARRVMTGFPGTFPRARRALHTGNPVRPAIAAVPPPAQRLAGRQGPLRLLVIGGSQGARALNQAVPRALATLPSPCRPLVRHQCGARWQEEVAAEYRRQGLDDARVEPFIEDMAEAYAWADLVVCRAGALTVAELAAAGSAAILVPYPHAVDDHQTRNAMSLVEQGAALLVPEGEAFGERLADCLRGFAREDGADRPRLLAMAEAARRQARPDAAERVAQLCLEAAHG